MSTPIVRVSPLALPGQQTHGTTVFPLAYQCDEPAQRDDVVGWAPMPPDDYLIDADDEPHFWSFMHLADVIAPSAANVVLPLAQTSGYINQTVVVNPTIVVRELDRVVVAFLAFPPRSSPRKLAIPLRPLRFNRT